MEILVYLGLYGYVNLHGAPKMHSISYLFQVHVYICRSNPQWQDGVCKIANL